MLACFKASESVTSSYTESTFFVRSNTLLMGEKVDEFNTVSKGKEKICTDAMVS